MIYLQRIASIFSHFALATPVHRWVQFHAQRSSSTAARRDSRTTRRSENSGDSFVSTQLLVWQATWTAEIATIREPRCLLSDRGSTLHVEGPTRAFRLETAIFFGTPRT